MSYLSRYVFDEFFNAKLIEQGDAFKFWLSYDLILYAEGLAYVALLLFHKSNFKEVKQTQQTVHEHSFLTESVNDDAETVVILNYKTNNVT